MDPVRPFGSTYRRTRLAFFLAVLLGIAFSTSARADVFVVDDDGTTGFTSLQAAVDAAREGDLVLVQPGTYFGFSLQGKGITVAGLSTPDAVQLVGTTTIRDLDPGQVARLVALTLRGRLDANDPAKAAALRGLGCDGSVRVDGCAILGGTLDRAGGEGAAAAVDLYQCVDVVLMACEAIGSTGYSPDAESAGIGAPGLRVQRSHAVLLETTVTGGRGGSVPPFARWLPGEGGPGVLLLEGSLLDAVLGRIDGGLGGPGGESPARGGTGLFLDATSHATLRATDIAGGSGGYASACDCSGPSGPVVGGLGIVDRPAVVDAPFDVQPRVVEPGDSLILTGRAPVLVLASFFPTLHVVPHTGPLIVAPPWVKNGVTVLTTPMQVAVPTLPPGHEGVAFEFQGLTPHGLGPARSLVWLDRIP